MNMNREKIDLDKRIGIPDEINLDKDSLPSPSLPSDEEKKKSVINKILDDLPIREVRGEMSPDEWYGWFEEVYDKAFSLCSTRIAEMERELKEAKQLVFNITEFADGMKVLDGEALEVLKKTARRVLSDKPTKL